MSNPFLQQQNKPRTIAFAFTLLLLLALASESSHLQFLYGITFSLTSLFVLLGLRIFGFVPGLLTATVVPCIGIFLFDQPAYHLLLLVEAAVIGLFLSRFKNRLFRLDAAFWLLIGMPTAYGLHAANSTLASKDLILITCIIALNGMFNALFAEMIQQYFPLRKWSGFAFDNRRPRSFSRVLFHFSLGIVFLSFLLNIYVNSLSSFKEACMYAQRLSSSEANRILNIWNEWQPMNSGITVQEQARFLQSLLQSSPSDLVISFTNSTYTVVASSRTSLVGQLLHYEADSRTTIVNPQLLLTMPPEKKYSLELQTWHDGQFVYKDNVSASGFQMYIELPIKHYQNYLFSKYLTHFYYLIGLAIFAAILAYLINRWLSQSLQRLAAVTTDLPLTLEKSDTVVWPASGFVEIQSLIVNFKQMSTNLIHLFQEARNSNERLEAQAIMLQQSEERLHQLAYSDMLTGLPNRLQFTLYVQEMIDNYARFNKPIAVMFADINRFKQINDTLGHAVGDQLLQKAAERFEAAALQDCKVFRLGGDEFVFVGHYEDEAAIRVKGQAVVDSFNEPFVLAEARLFLTVSVGISHYPQDGDNMDTIISNADIAMYSAKEQGDGCYRLFTPQLVSTMTEKMQLENELYPALQQNQFSLHYQPKMNAATGELCGIEALIRWRHPELGMVPPDKFIPLAEQSGFILEIDSWVFREACRQNKAWQDAGLQRICVSVNISARHFYQGQLSEMIVQALKDTGLEPQYVSLEITEGVFMQNMEQVIETIQYLRALGIQISIDDFGTGYSSLNQLQRLPISDVKLDRSFIQGITSDEKKSSIVKAIIQLIHSMNMKVVAEGVETDDESRFCKELQCDELQGYLFSRPLPPQELALMLSTHVEIPTQH
ncbi:putative bifunctional diguanylate cyclase/phosphodiesterase [Paenibacillus luteus]|uniref:putative bifunctional diguanylate cyclase/phosphodiesterase n=1 Tax=Paenibacillus luteus TaxID=2545753 RepID=UPI00114493E1|nr:EAL domain-containing protein [Paenibacillus luteus]